MRETKDIISKLFERIDNPMLASLFMYLIYIADENGVVNETYADIGNAFKISKQLTYKYISRLRTVYGVFTDNAQLTISNIGYYRGFTHTSFTGRLRGVDENKKKMEEVKAEETLTDDPEMNKVIEQWLAYKKEKKQTYKPIGLKTLINKLLKFSNNDAGIARQIVEQSIMNNYAGLFPLKQNNGSNKNLPSGMNLQNSKEIDYGKGLGRFNNG